VQQNQRIAVIGVVPWSIVHFRGPLLQAMIARGHEVTALATRPDGSMRASIERLGVSFREVPFDRGGLNPILDLGVVRKLVGILRELRPDVVLSYTIKPVIYGSFAARLARVPKSFSMIEGLGYAFGKGSLTQALTGRVATLLYRFTLPHNRGVFFLNPDDRETFVRLGLLDDADRRAVLLRGGIGVDLDHYHPVPLPETPSFLFMGRFLRDKGVREYVEAARLIKARHPEIAFRLLGNVDPGSSAISPREVEAWIAEGVVEHLGTLRDVRPAIARTSVFVLPSYYPEGQPRTIMEAMAMGRPIITTDWTGCRETVEPGRNGFLIPPRDVPSLTEAMRRFIEHPDQIERMGRESRRLAESKYDVHEINRVMLEAMELA
jgi:glycosyltransferase involved in cell wall biosynthesis